MCGALVCDPFREWVSDLCTCLLEKPSFCRLAFVLDRSNHAITIWRSRPCDNRALSRVEWPGLGAGPRGRTFKCSVTMSARG